MTVSSQISKNGPYDCNGSQVAFPFTFKVFTKNDLIVVLTDIATDIETDLVVDTNYTVSLNADQNNNPGGTVTTVTTYPTGKKITIARDIALTQQVNVTNFRPDVIERTFDKLTMLIQQVQEGVGRAIKTKISSEDSPDELMAALDASVQAATTAASQAGAYASEAENQAMDAATAAGEAQAAANAAATSPVAAPTHAATSKTTPVDNDEIPLIDSAQSFGLKKLTFGNLKTWLKSLFVFLSEDQTIDGIKTFVKAPVLPNFGKVIVNTPNGYGSTNGCIPRFSNVVVNSGSDITYADSAANGASFTIVNTGVYCVSITEVFTAGGRDFGISVNSSQLTTGIFSINSVNIVRGATTGALAQAGTCGLTLKLSAGDVIRPHTNGDIQQASSIPSFSIERIL